MTIKMTFVCEEHEEFGELGLRPADVPNADPLTGMAIPHDMLEHFPGDDGGVEAEFMALGAALLLRGETGWWQRDGNINSPDQHIASDFVDLYRHVAYEGFALLDPGTVEPVNDCADDVLSLAVRKGLALVREEEEPSEILELFTCTQSAERILGWLRKGYAKAEERYASVDIYTLVYSCFGIIETGVDKWLESGEAEGKTLDVEINLENLEVSMSAGYGAEGEYMDDCYECEGSGELDGEAEGNYQDCPQGCTEAGKDDCTGCKGEGYIAPPVKCENCKGEGVVDASYRETILH